MEIPESKLFNWKEIYRDPTGKTLIYFADYHADPSQPPTPVAVKVIACRGMLEPYIYIEESMNQSRIPSDNVCKIYGWCMQPERVIIVMERMDKDLCRDIKDRVQHGFCYYTELELITLCAQVIKIFAQMQRMHQSHNDIKAENIFLSTNLAGDIVYKVGDFGSTSTNRGHGHILAGTPLYLSPVLKEAFKKGIKTVSHDPVKSDVFSLGVTLLFAATLLPPEDLMEISMLQQKIDVHLERVRQMVTAEGTQRYPFVHSLLVQMLQTDEKRRCDFVQIEDYLVQNFPYIAQPERFFQTMTAPVKLNTTVDSGLDQNYLAKLNESLQMSDWENSEFFLTVFLQRQPPRGLYWTTAPLCEHSTSAACWVYPPCDACYSNYQMWVTSRST